MKYVVVGALLCIAVVFAVVAIYAAGEEDMSTAVGATLIALGALFCARVVHADSNPSE